MISLYISAYPEKYPKRQAELTTCLFKNIANEAIDRIFILTEKFEENYLPDLSEFEGKKVWVLPVTERPTFRTFFTAINHITDKDDINILSNSDIYFEAIPKVPSDNECYALARYDVKKNGQITLLNRDDAQDSWLMKGFIKIPVYCDFNLGVKGCDNRIAKELSNIGYQMSNPSLTIKSFHLHEFPTDHHKSEKKVYPPYLRLKPTEL